MRYRTLIAVSLTSCITCFAAGCRRDPYLNLQLETMAAERRSLEDELYELEYENERLASRLERLEREDSPRRSYDSSRDRDGRDDPNGLDFSIPQVEEGQRIEPQIEIPGVNVPGAAVVPNDETFIALDPPPELVRDSSDVARIKLKAQFTGGWGSQSDPATDGIRVAIEPVDKFGSIVLAPGDISVVVLDPAEMGDAARVARWDVQSEAVERALVRRGNGLIYLELPWPEQPPQNAELHLFVRYITSDGRKLQADRELAIDVPPLGADRWTARADQSRGSTAGDPSLDQPSDDDDPSRTATPEWKPYR